MIALRSGSYPSYKPSGTDWLGDVPEHWGLQRIKYVAPFRIDRSASKPAECEYVGLENIESRTGRLLLENQPEIVDSVVSTFKAGDVLFGKLRPYLAKAASPGFDGVCTSELLVLRPTARVSPRFLLYALLNQDAISELNSLTFGTKMPRLSPDHLGCLLVPVPPKQEQEKITQFLDGETERIDALVAKKERLIELLQEKRTALITRAVTKGLDPSVAMKESGAEWLGAVPTHWDCRKVWQVSSASSGGTPSRDQGEYWDGDIPWVSPKDMKSRFLDSSEERITSRGMMEAGLRLIPPATVLIVVRGMILVHTFPVSITSVPTTINQDMKAIVFRKGIASTFMAWQLEGIAGALLPIIVETAAHGTRAIRMDQWRNVVVAIPPVSEQRAITAFLDRATGQIDSLMAKVREAIERLKELRTGLISAAVTGKIDVRGSAA